MTAKASKFEDLAEPNPLELSASNSSSKSPGLCHLHLVTSITPNLHQTRFGIATNHCPLVYGQTNGRLEQVRPHEKCRPWVSLAASPATRDS